MRTQRTLPTLALFALFTAVPAGAAAQSVLVEARTTAGDEVATIRTDSMRLLVPLRVLAGGFSAGYVAVGDSLRVGGEGSFVAAGTYNGTTTVPPPASGAGTRMMWFPEKAAFRVGNVTGAQWDDSNIGFLSTALGYNTTASGLASSALGHQTVASNYYSTALGGNTTASGTASTAAGYNTTASGNASTASGQYTAALGDFSTAFGFNPTAGAAYSTALGSLTVANGLYSTALGLSSTAQAYASVAVGRYNVVQGNATSWVATDPLFVAGNGTDASTPSDALTLYKNGNLTIAGTLTQSSDARLKEDIEPLEGTLERVLRLTPIRYHFRAGTGRPAGAQIGLTAQQVRPLFPELVKQDRDGYLSLSYANLSAVLVKAVQEQQAEIAPLQARIEALRERNRELESELAALRASQSEILRRLRTLEAGASR
jgi:hypothetical protein